MKRRILKLTAISALAMVLGSACNKKDDTGAVIDAGNNLAQCPNMPEVTTTHPENYSLQGSVKTPAKLLTVYKVLDEKDSRRSYYALSFNGREYVVINGSNSMQPQGKSGSLKAGCVGGQFLVSGTDLQGGQVGIHISTKANDKGEKGLQVDDFYYLETSQPAADIKSLINGFKNLASDATAGVAVTGLPQPGDVKAP